MPGPWRDPALLEWQRGGRFELRIFPIPPHRSRHPDHLFYRLGRRRSRVVQNPAPDGRGALAFDKGSFLQLSVDLSASRSSCASAGRGKR